MKRRGNGEGMIHQRKDGRWEARITSADGRRKSLYGTRRQDVAQKLTVALRARQQGISVFSDRTSVAEYLRLWLEGNKSSLRARTYRRYEQIVRVHLTPLLGRVVLSRLQPVQVQRLYAERLAAGSAPRTVHHIHMVLRRALGQAERWGYVPRNVATLVETPRAPRYEIASIGSDDRDAERARDRDVLVQVALGVGEARHGRIVASGGLAAATPG
jgi:integrase